MMGSDESVVTAYLTRSPPENGEMRPRIGWVDCPEFREFAKDPRYPRNVTFAKVHAAEERARRAGTLVTGVYPDDHPLQWPEYRTAAKK